MIQYILHALWPNPEFFIWCWWFFILKTVLLTSQDSSDSPWKWSLWSHSCFSFMAQSTTLTFQEVLCCWEQSCFLSAFLSGYLLLSQQLSQAHEATLMECTKHFQTASVRDRHLSYFTHSASWNPCLDLHPGKLLNLWRPNFPPFWSPIPVFCPVHENWNTTVVRFCQPLCCWWPGNKPTSKCPDQALVHSRLALPCTSPCWEPWTSLDLAPLSKELKY